MCPPLPREREIGALWQQCPPKSASNTSVTQFHYVLSHPTKNAFLGQPTASDHRQGFSSAQRSEKEGVRERRACIKLADQDKKNEMSHKGQAPQSTHYHSVPWKNQPRGQQGRSGLRAVCWEHSYFIRWQEKAETSPEGYKSNNLSKLFKI